MISKWLLVLLGLLCCISHADAHDHYEWMIPYEMEGGGSCCGEIDCGVVKQFLGNGWITIENQAGEQWDAQISNQATTHVSPDTNIYACGGMVEDEGDSTDIRCIWYPPEQEVSFFADPPR